MESWGGGGGGGGGGGKVSGGFLIVISACLPVCPEGQDNPACS